MKHDAQQTITAAIKELAQQLDAGHSAALTDYLECLSRFHRYSWTNVLLIHRQFPTATRVAGFRRWQQLDRRVRKGEKGIGILAPLVRRHQSAGPTPEPSADPTGTTCIAGFRIVYVFDVSQTEGKALPNLSRPVGAADEQLRLLERVVQQAEIKLVYRPLELNVQGYSAVGEIGIEQSLAPVERLTTLVHELAHQWLGHLQERTLGTRIRELEAEASAFVVARACGIDAIASSSDYIQLYKGDSVLLGNSLGRIQAVTKRILDAMQQQESESVQQAMVVAA